MAPPSDSAETESPAAWAIVYRVASELARRCAACRAGLETALRASTHAPALVALLLATAGDGLPVSFDPPSDGARRLLASPVAELELAAHPEVPSPRLARALLEEGRLAEPSRAERSARLALLALGREDPTSSPDLRLAAQLQLAQALRLEGRLEEAGRLLDASAEELARVRSRALRGDLHLLASSIRSAQGRVEEALVHLLLAQRDYAPLEDPSRTARALIQLAAFHRHSGNLDAAIESAAAAHASVAPGPADVRLSAGHNLAAYLIDAGEHDRAREVLESVAHLYPSAPDSPAALRYRRLCARLAEASGDHAGAAAAYRDIRDRLVALDLHREAALTVVDLAYLHLSRDDLDGCRDALDSLDPILEALPAAASQREVRALLARARDDFEPGVLLHLSSALDVA